MTPVRSRAFVCFPEPWTSAHAWQRRRGFRGRLLLTGAALLLCAVSGWASGPADPPAKTPAAVASLDGMPAALVDAPSAVLARSAAFSSSLSEGGSAGDEAPQDGVPGAAPRGVTRADRRQTKLEREAHRNTECEDGVLHGKPCRVSWARVVGSSFIMLAAQHGGNLVMDNETRVNVTQGHFWDNYVYCVEHYRWSRWKDDDPFGVDWVGHPMMGSMTSFIYEQNDPKQRALEFENSKRYWHGRLKAMAYSAAYSAQWKVGPASEASIGNTGHLYYIRRPDGLYTNETGMQDWFVTPIFGFGWNVGEDLVDRYIESHIRHAHPHNRVLVGLTTALMEPTRTAANITRFRGIGYRDKDERELGIAPVK